MDSMMSDNQILKTFIAQATEHGLAIAEGDHKKANKLHKKIQALYDQAKKDDITHLFEQLLKDNNENVRLWAATFSLKSSPQLAEETLNNLTELTTITGLSAKTTLQLWNQGKLSLL